MCMCMCLSMCDNMHACVLASVHAGCVKNEEESYQDNSDANITQLCTLSKLSKQLSNHVIV